MDILLHLIVVKIIKFVWKDENKRKRVRGWPIFLKKRRGPIYKRINAKQESWLVAIMSDLCNNRQWQKTTTGVVFPSKLFCAKIESSWIKRWVGGRSKKTLFDLPWIVRSGDKKNLVWKYKVYRAELCNPFRSFVRSLPFSFPLLLTLFQTFLAF